MTTSAQTLAVLKRARELLTPPGAWIQGRMHGVSDTSRCCLVGALRRVGSEVPAGTWLEAILAVRAAAGMPDDSVPGLADWNDAPGRTQAEVLAVLDKAIEEAGRG